MKDLLGCGMTPAEVEAEAQEAERETAEFEAKREADRKAYLIKLTKDARYYQTHKAKRKFDKAMRRASEAGAESPRLSEEVKGKSLRSMCKRKACQKLQASNMKWIIWCHFSGRTKLAT